MNFEPGKIVPSKSMVRERIQRKADLTTRRIISEVTPRQDIKAQRRDLRRSRPRVSTRQLATRSRGQTAGQLSDPVGQHGGSATSANFRALCAAGDYRKSFRDRQTSSSPAAGAIARQFGKARQDINYSTRASHSGEIPSRVNRTCQDARIPRSFPAPVKPCEFQRGAP